MVGFTLVSNFLSEDLPVALGMVTSVAAAVAAAVAVVAAAVVVESELPLVGAVAAAAEELPG